MQSPNGDISYNGSAGINCGGFVGYVLRKVGLDSSVKVNMMSVVHATSTAVNMKRSIARAL